MTNFRQLTKDDFKTVVSYDKAHGNYGNYRSIGKGYLTKMFAQKNLNAFGAFDGKELKGFILGTIYRGTGRLRHVRISDEKVINGLYKLAIEHLKKQEDVREIVATSGSDETVKTKALKGLKFKNYDVGDRYNLIWERIVEKAKKANKAKKSKKNKGPKKNNSAKPTVKPAEAIEGLESLNESLENILAE